MKNYLDVIPAETEMSGCEGALVGAFELCEGAMNSKEKLIILMIGEDNQPRRFTANVSYGEAYLMLSQEMHRVMAEISP